MTEKLIPSGSQTVGPFFHIGLQRLVDRQRDAQSIPNALELRGRVLDRDGASVPDALLEFWRPAPRNGAERPDRNTNGLPQSFYRVATEDDGGYAVTLSKPAQFGDEPLQAPHFLVLVFARGLLLHLLTRVYFMNDATAEADPVLSSVPAERRRTLIARETDAGVFQWDVVLQGQDETAFFAW
jgi:protocatechuate 3,4-dioxygenase, alpha subunit